MRVASALTRLRASKSAQALAPMIQIDTGPPIRPAAKAAVSRASKGGALSGRYTRAVGPPC